MRSARLPLWVAGVLLGALLTLLLGGDSWPPDNAGAQTQTHSPPVFSASETGHRAVAENTASGTNIGAPFSATDPEGQTVTYSLKEVRSGDTTTAFSINATTGQLSTSEPLDFETKQIYLITVEARDPNGHGRSRSITVRVTDVDEAPSITRSTPTSLTTTDSTSFTHDQAASPSRIATFTATDPDGDPVTWSVGGADAAQFSINSAGQLSFAVTPNVNAPADTGGDNTYNVTVNAADPAGHQSQHPVTVTITGILGPASLDREEGRDRIVAFYTVANLDEGSTGWSWGLDGVDAGDFEMKDCDDDLIYYLHGCTSRSAERTAEIGVVRFKNLPQFSNPLDANRDNTYHFNIFVTENGKRTRTVAVTVKIHDLGGVPTVANVPQNLGSTSVTVEENSTGVEWQYRVSDPNRRSVTVALGGEDAGDFALDSAGFGGLHYLSFRSVPDFEKPLDSNTDNVYTLFIKAHNGVATTIHPITVTVTDQAEPPQIRGPSSVKFEVRGTGTVAAYTARDDDSSPLDFVVRGTDQNLFNISATGELTYKTPPTAAATHRVRVRARAGGGVATQELTVNVVASGTNTAPGTISQLINSAHPSFLDFPENRTDPGIGTYQSTDPDGDTIFWSLSGDDAAHFRMDLRDDGDGRLNWLELPDFETKLDANTDNAYKVTVTASDGIATATKEVTVTVTDVNEPPSVTGQRKVSRAGGSNRAVATYTATDAEGDTVSWTLTGKDADDFTISSAGALSFTFDPNPASPQDAEGDNVYHVVVKASAGTHSDTLPVEVTITGGATNAAPTVTAGPTTKNHPENSTAAIGTYTASDADGDRITWSLAGVDADRFTINAAGELSFRAVPDFENKLDTGADNVYEVTVTASDGTASGTRAVAVTVTNVDEAPVVSGEAVVVKTSFGGTAVGTYSAADPEGQTVEFRRAGPDHRLFTIDQDGQLSFNANPVFGTTLDANGDNIFDVTVSARVGGKVGRLRVLIALHDQDLSPTIDAGGAAPTAAENSTGVIHTYSATDPEGATVSWDLSGTDASHFRIDSAGKLRFRSRPDFETPADANSDNDYEVTVVAVDGTHRVERDVTVSVTNVDEGPTLSGKSSVNFAENGTGVVETYTADDPEGDAVAWTLSGTDSSSFTLVGGVLRFKAQPDHENKTSYLFRVTATAGGKSAFIEVVVTVTNVNEPPVITGDAVVTVDEGHTDNIARWDANDPERDSITWSVAGTDSGSFASPPLGVSVFFPRFAVGHHVDFETKSSYSISIVASAGGQETSFPVTINVRNNDEPGTVGLSASRPAEDAVVKATLSDPDGSTSGESWQWSQVDGETVTEISGATSASYTPVLADVGKRLRVTVGYTDPQGSGKSATETSGIVVAAGNRAPVFAEDTASHSVDENTASGTNLGEAFTATDADQGDTLTYSLDSGDGASFAIGAATGQLSTSAALDFENKATYTVTVTATDSAGATDTITVTITVNDVEEEGTVTLSPSTPVVGTAVTASLSDPDGGVTSESWVWSADGTAIESATSASYTPVEGDIGKSLTASVMYTDRRGSGKTAASQGVNVLAEANHPPTLTCTTTDTSVSENGGTAVDTYTATDPEGVDVTWSREGPDQGDFTISSAGALSFVSVPDFENPADSNTDNIYRVTVVASDGTNRVTCGVTVRVTNVDETGSLTLLATPRVGAALTVTLSDPDDVRSATWRWIRVGGTAISGARSTTTSSTYTPVQGDEGEDLSVTVTYTDGHGSGKTLTTTTGTVGERQNQAPHFPDTTATRSVPENTPAGRTIGAAFTATDPDRDTLSYTLGGTDAASFTLDSSRRLRTSAALDHETTPDYTVTITATDPGGLSHSVTVTIEVTDVDEPPEFVQGGAAHDYAEDRSDFVDTYSANDPETGVAAEYSLTGTDAADFDISTFGELTFKSQPDFEDPDDSNRDNRYHVRVRAVDGQSNASTLNVTVTVTNVDEPGVITFSNVQPQVTIPLRATLTDPDGRVRSVTWQWSVGGTAIDGATRASYTPRDDDIDGILSVVANYTDRHGSGKTVTETADNAVIAAPPVPYPPTFPDEESGRREIEENTAAGQPIGEPVAATDANEGETELLVYTLDSSGETFFDIDSATGQLSTKAELDYERRRGYRVRVTATDPANTTGVIWVTVSVIDVDEEPVIDFSSGSAAEEFLENRSAPVVRVRARDPENERVSMELGGTDGDLFSLAGGAIRFKEPPNYESPQDSGGDNVYELTVVATEDDDDNPQTTELTARQDIVITVTDVNEPPVPSPAAGSATERTVDEGHEGPVGTYEANDPENFAIAWSLAGSDANDFTISVDGELEFKEVPDHESRLGSAGPNRNVYRVTLRASDGRHTGTLGVTVTVTNVEEPATITFSQEQPQIGTPIMATIVAPDARSAVRWVWDGAASADAGRGAGSPVGPYTLSLAPAGAIPGDRAQAAAQYLQRSGSSPQYTPVDADYGAGVAVTAHYTDSLGRPQRVRGSTGGWVREPPAEGTNTAPTFPSQTFDFSVEERNEPAGTVIATIEAADSDVYTSRDHTVRDAPFLAYSLNGADSAHFEIVTVYDSRLEQPSTGEFRTKAPLDFENPRDANRDNVYEVQVTVTDPSGASATTTVTIEVTNVNEDPVLSGHEVIFYKSGNTGTVTTFKATDPEKGDITWSLSGDDEDDFDLDDGVLSFKTAPDHEAPADLNTDNRYQITVTAEDPESKAASLTVTVAVTSTTVRTGGGPTGGGPTGGGPTGGGPIGGGPGPGGGGPPPEPEEPRRVAFTDVDAGSVHAANIDALRDAGITGGCSVEPLRFCPERAVTRAQMATFLVRALKLPAAAPAGFTDVGARSVHAANIDALRDAGITGGCSAEPLRFCPDRVVTRAQMATFLVRALKLPRAVPAGFADVDANSVHAANIDALYRAGITGGCASSPLRFCPDRVVTRAQMATFLIGALKAAAESQ